MIKELAELPESITDVILAGQYPYDPEMMMWVGTYGRAYSFPLGMFKFTAGNQIHEELEHGDMVSFDSLYVQYPGRTDAAKILYSDSLFHNVYKPALQFTSMYLPPRVYWSLYGIMGETFDEVFEQLPEVLREDVLIERLS